MDIEQSTNHEYRSLPNEDILDASMILRKYGLDVNEVALAAMEEYQLKTTSAIRKEAQSYLDRIDTMEEELNEMEKDKEYWEEKAKGYYDLL